MSIKLFILLFCLFSSLLELFPVLQAKEKGESEKIRFGILYKGNRDEMASRYKKLENVLKEKEFSLEIRYFKDPQEIDNLVEEMRNGKIDIAGEFSPLDYLESERHLMPLVRTIWNGRDFYYGTRFGEQ